MGADGQIAEQLSLAGITALSSSQLAVGGSAAVALSADGSSVCAAELSAGQLSCQRLDSLLPSAASAAGAQLLEGSCGGHAVVQVAGGAALLALGGSSGATLAKFVAGATASGCFQDSSAAPVVALATPSPSGLQLQVLSAADGSPVQQAPAVAGLAPQRVGGEPVPVAALYAAAYRQDGQQAFRHLALFEDDSLALVADGTRAWVRHEELAAVTGEGHRGRAGRAGRARRSAVATGGAPLSSSLACPPARHPWHPRRAVH